MKETIIKRTITVLALLCSASAHADTIDDTIAAEMKLRRIPGLSLAIIEGGKIVKVRGYGVTEKDGKAPVTPSTLFQAGSISKSVAALGALSLVERGKLILDEDVNVKLAAWKVPDNEFTANSKVTLRRLLSHTAGLTVHGFPGYATDVPMPSAVQVLNGEKPANTAPVRVNVAPGSTWRYSGGGYTVMQQMVVDVTAKPFPEFMREAVLAPLGMRESSFLQPLPADRASATAAGHYGDRRAVKGRWHLYPEMAAAGLWTNPSDLARFAIGIQQSLAATSNPVISAALTRQMLTDQKNNDGLGVFLKGSGKEQQFSHNGRDEGFDAAMVAYSETGQGAVIMINANDNSRAVGRILAAIGREYHWPGAPAAAAVIKPADVAIDPATLESYTGRYEASNNFMVTFGAANGRLFTSVDGLPDEEFAPAGKQRFQSVSGNTELSFVLDAAGRVAGATLKADGHERQAPRIGPLPGKLAPRADPDPARTAKVKAVFEAAARGPTALADLAFMAAEGKSMGLSPELAGIGPLTFLLEQDVAGRAIERHGGKVDKVVFYKQASPGFPPYLMVFLTADGKFTDYDLVAD